MDIIPDGGETKAMGMRKRFNKSRLLAAANRDSFYIVLFMCLVVLGVTAVWVTRNNINYFSQEGLPDAQPRIQEEYQIEELPPDDNSQTVLIDDGPGDVTQTPREEQRDTEPDKPAAEQPAAPDKEQPAAAASSQQVGETAQQERMMLPLQGKIIMDYAKDNLVYSKTLEQWTTHNGIDIAAGVGTPVKAVMSGKVTQVTNHPMLGIMITIDHGNGLLSRYANLQNGNMVKEGQDVERGKVISGVGNTAEFEIGDEPHLHFEVLKGGEHVDPKLHLPNM
jgi:murein DD-endopeptidase MepM/ murein hydrolase activator NlpD